MTFVFFDLTPAGGLGGGRGGINSPSKAYRAQSALSDFPQEIGTPLWCSILVRAAGSQEGPKNPLKGIAMKPVVPALNASLGWVLEGRFHQKGNLAISGLSSMA